MRFLATLAATLLAYYTLLTHRWAQIARNALRYGSPRQVRVFGATKFGDPAAYHEVSLTDQNRLEYMRDGFTIVRDALPPHLLRELEDVLRAEHGEMNSIWGHYFSFDSNSLQDFFAYSSLGKLAADLFQTPGMETASEDPTVFLWRDFMYFRHPGVPLSEFHMDTNDCDRIALPPNATRTNRVRIWVPLHDDIQPPIFPNLTVILERLEDNAARDSFWRGKLDDMDLRRATDAPNPLAWLPMHMSWKLGDVVMHMPCLEHTSPMPAGMPYPGAVLFPTFTPGSGGIMDRSGHHTRACRSAFPHATRIDRDPSCYTQCWPPHARPARGSKRTITHAGSLSEWLFCSWIMDGREGTPPQFCYRDMYPVAPDIPHD